MSNRRRLAREKLEYYLTYLILAYRRLILVCGLILLVYATATMLIGLVAGNVVILLPAIFLILLSHSYTIVVYTARVGAWIGTIWLHND